MVGLTRRKKKKTRSDVVDKISHLPDDLICRILTLLSTKDAVQTTALSTRWRNLWHLVPELELDSTKFPSFSEFVICACSFLYSDKESWIQKLCLSIHEIVGTPYLNAWIDVAIKRRIQHLDISVSTRTGFGDIPLSLYTCETLVHLRLYRITMVNVDFVSLPCVKIIHLEHNQYLNEDILEKLISGSPVLEELTIFRGASENATFLFVRSKTLKSIHINEFIHVVIVDAPILQCLKTRVYLKQNFTILSSCFPAKVDIDFVTHNVTLIREILANISKVRELIINVPSWKDIFPSSVSGPLLQFCHLSQLSTTIYYPDLETLPMLLQRCPKLQSLILELIKNPSDLTRKRKNNEPKVTFHSVVIPCLVSSLKFMELKSPILGYNGEIELVKYFLKNSTILEKLSVVFSGHHRKRRKSTDVILKELLALPRCSSACQLVVV